MGHHHETRDPGLQEPQLLQLHSPAERKTFSLRIFIYELKGRILSPGYANHRGQRKVGLLTIMMYVHWAVTIKENIDMWLAQVPSGYRNPLKVLKPETHMTKTLS